MCNVRVMLKCCADKGLYTLDQFDNGDYKICDQQKAVIKPLHGGKDSLCGGCH